MTPFDDEVPLGEGQVAWRLRQLETTVGKLDHRLGEVANQLDHRIASLGLVPRGEYIIEMRATMERIEGAKAIAESARSLAMWAIALVASTAIGAIVTGLLIKAAG